MKKLLAIAVAAIGVSMSASAAEVAWAMYGQSYADWNGSAIGASSDITAILYAFASESTGISYSSGAFAMNGASVLDSRTWSTDLEGWGSAADDPMFTTTSVGSNETQYFQIVLVEGSNTDLSSLADGTHFYLGTASGVSGDPDPTPGSSGYVGYSFLDDSTTLTAGSWSTASVPEPTSGLLLLLGMAGLALRRKIA